MAHQQGEGGDKEAVTRERHRKRKLHRTERCYEYKIFSNSLRVLQNEVTFCQSSITLKWNDSMNLHLTLFLYTGYL